MMIWNRNNASAQTDPLGPFRSSHQKHFRRCDRLPSRRMMFADPKLIVAEVIEPGREVEIALKLQCWRFADWMMRCRKDTKPEPWTHVLGNSRRSNWI